MNIFLTFDYEIFFGKKSGTVEECMIEPTNELLKIAEKQQVKLTFFWDIGHYIALKRERANFPELDEDRDKIEAQIKSIFHAGHDVQLHIHPHWEKAVYTSSGWQMNLEKHYKLADFTEEEAAQLFGRYKNTLDQFVGKKSHAFRAGGWCIQPFSLFLPFFQKHEIRYDSSTMPGVKWITEQYHLDFSGLKTDEPFSFSTNECTEDPTGEFVEYPITTKYYSPWFFWKLYTLGRLFPSRHKMWGNGTFVPQPGGKRNLLTKGKKHHACTDGYFASELEAVLKQKMRRNGRNMVVIGHPKSMTRFSMEKLEKFVRKNKSKHRFLTFQDLPCD